MTYVSKLEEKYKRITNPDEIIHGKLRDFYIAISQNITGVVGYMGDYRFSQIHIAIEGWFLQVGTISIVTKNQNGEYTPVYAVESSEKGEQKFSKHMKQAIKKACSVLNRGSLPEFANNSAHSYRRHVTRETSELRNELSNDLGVLLVGDSTERKPNLSYPVTLRMIERFKEIADAGFESKDGDFNAGVEAIIRKREVSIKESKDVQTRVHGFFVFCDDLLLDGSKVCVYPLGCYPYGDAQSILFTDHTEQIAPHITRDGFVMDENNILPDIHRKVATLSMLEEGVYVKDVGVRRARGVFMIHSDKPAWENKEWLNLFGL